MTIDIETVASIGGVSSREAILREGARSQLVVAR